MFKSNSAEGFKEGLMNGGLEDEMIVGNQSLIDDGGEFGDGEGAKTVELDVAKKSHS